MNKILHWDLTVRIKTKHQVKNIVTKILNEEIDFNFSVEKELLAIGEQYVLTIHDMPWANNLKTISKILIAENEKEV